MVNYIIKHTPTAGQEPGKHWATISSGGLMQRRGEVDDWMSLLAVRIIRWFTWPIPLRAVGAPGRITAAISLLIQRRCRGGQMSFTYLPAEQTVRSGSSRGTAVSGRHGIR